MKAADGVQIADRWKPEYGDTVCQVCLRPNPLWFTPNELWNAVVKPQTGVFCPVCFIEFAAASGFDHAWVLLPEDRYDDLSRAEERERVLREALVASRDVLVAFQKQAGWNPAQKAYSTKVTEGEMQLSQAVADIDAILTDAALTAAPEQGKEAKS